MCALLETFQSNPALKRKPPPGTSPFDGHFRWERAQHRLALQKGAPPLDSPVHYWKRRPGRPNPGARRYQDDWTVDTLLVSGYDLFQLRGTRAFSQAVQKLVDIPGRVLPAPPAGGGAWTAYQKVPTPVRLEFNAAAYELTAARCKIVKDIDLDPPRKVAAPALLEALAAFTATDTAQLIIEFAVDPYLANHLRCCASTAKNNRCPFPRSQRYCPIPVGCCVGFQVEPDTCLYDVCSFHLLKKNCTNLIYYLVSCE